VSIRPKIDRWELIDFGSWNEIHKEQDATLPLEPRLRNAATDFRCLDGGRARAIEEFVSIGENESSFADSSQLNAANSSSPRCPYLVSVKAADDFRTRWPAMKRLDNSLQPSFRDEFCLPNKHVSQ
jgi:hypothetical protein